MSKKVKLPDWYKDVQITDKKYTKQVKYGARKYTTINATSQIMKASEIFGLLGDGWGISEPQWNVIRDQIQKPLFLTLDAVFYYPNGEIGKEDGLPQVAAFPVSSEIEFYDSKGKLVSDLRKKLNTDIITKGLSRIGFNADIYLGMWDDNKYTDYLEEQEPLVKAKLPAELKKQMVAAIKAAPNEKNIDYVVKRLRDFKVSDKDQKELNLQIDKKREGLSDD